MNHILILVGESGCGKSTTAGYLLEYFRYQKKQNLKANDSKFDFHRIISYTTRPQRTGELDGVDYHFISEQKFQRMERQDAFVETGAYRGWHYGSAKVDYTGNILAILTPYGMRRVKKVFANSTDHSIHVVYLDVPRKDRLIKILLRGDDIDEAYRRSLSDVGQFDGVRDEADIIVENPGFSKSAQKVAEEIIRQIDF